MIGLYTQAWALLPIEGIIYGKVKGIKQLDPFRGLLQSTYRSQENAKSGATSKISSYFALYQQGQNLQNLCNKGQGLEFSNKVKEDTALRSIAANVQYIGLNYSLRNIANYMKLLEFSEIEYQNLYKNLVSNSCSQNLTVFSHKMLRANFKHFWNHNTGLEPPSLKGSKYFGTAIQKNVDTRKNLERELYYTLSNFKSLCSWNSDTSDFGSLTPYLKNPYLMSSVFNNMQRRKVELDPKTGATYFTTYLDAPQVVCENLICRKRSSSDFKSLFPSLSGSTGLEEDLKLLYCEKLLPHRSNNRNKRTASRKKNANKTTQIIEAMNLVSQITGISEILLTVDRLSDVSEIMRLNLKERWDLWANKNSDDFDSEQQYEESLEVSLVSQASLNSARLGEFRADLNVDLGEIDKLLGGYDKIDATFYLEFPVSLIETLKQNLTYSYNKSKFKEVAKLEKDFIEKVNFQLEKKKKYFKIPIWNERLGELVASELISQFIQQKQKPNLRLSAEFKKIPVTFHFGVFALQYVRDKFKYRYLNSNKISFQQ